MGSQFQSLEWHLDENETQNEWHGMPRSFTRPAPGIPRAYPRLIRIDRIDRIDRDPRSPQTRGVRRRRRLCVESKAALLDVGPTVSLAVHAGVGSTMLLAVAASLSIPRGAADRAPAPPPDGVDDFEDSVRWSVITVLSLFPYFNFASWAFAAIDAGAGAGLGTGADDEDDEEGGEAGYFWLLSGLYFVPYLVDGFQLDTFTLATILLGAAHVYVGPIPSARMHFSTHRARQSNGANAHSPAHPLMLQAN